MPKRNYVLNTGVGLFVDTEDGLKVLPGVVVAIDETKAGQMTQNAIRHKALVETEAKATENSQPAKTDDSDLPSDFPGRDAFVAAGMSFDQVKNFDFEKDKVSGVGAATIKAVQDYLKK